MHSIIVPAFRLENGTELRDVEVVYSSWGQLNASRNNAVLVCHTLTGDTNVSDWWGPLLGPGRALDTDRHFVLCASVIGSPYGGLSPLTTNPATGERFGSQFPDVTVRDTVALHRRLLDELGVTGVEFAIGSSLGGMQALELALVDDRVTGVVPIACGVAHSGWGIAWSETQRQCIFADPKWNGGNYDPDDPPALGLANARMVAMLSYRCSAEYNSRFGRASSGANGSGGFDVSSYLNYQGEKLVARFDANCYVSLTRQMNSYDLGDGRGGAAAALARLEAPVLVIGITSDYLYPLEEQEELVALAPGAELIAIDSPHGHDAILIELDLINQHVKAWSDRRLEEEVRCHEA